MILENGDKILEKVKGTIYEVFPYTYYVSGSMISYSPGEGGVRVDAYVVKVGKCSLVAQFIGEECVLEAFPTGVCRVSEILQHLVEFIRGERDLELTHHEREAVARLFFLDVSQVERAERISALRRYLSDKKVAIIGESVYVLSKGKVLERFDGREAVDIARRFSFVVDAPVREIASHISSFISGASTIFASKDSSLICDSKTCIDVPLPKDKSILVARNIPNSVYVDIEAQTSPRKRLAMPGDAIAFFKGYVATLKRSDDNYTVIRKYEFKGRVPFPVIFTRDGLRRYAKVTSRDSVELIEISSKTASEEEREEERELEYISQAI